MKNVVAVLMVLALAGSAFALNANMPSLSDAVMYVPYDEGAGTVTTDWANGYHGTLMYQDQNGAINLNGGNQVYAGSNAWTAGKWGSALQAYGNGDAWDKVMDTHIMGAGYTDPWGGAGYSQDWTYSFWVNRPTGRHIGWGASYVNSFDFQDWITETSDETVLNWHSWTDLRYDHLHTRYDEWASDPYSGRNLNIGHSAGGSWDKNNVGYALGTEWGSGEWVNMIITVDGDPAADENQPGQQRFVTTVYINGVAVTQISESGWGWGWTPAQALTMGVSQQLKGIDTNDKIDDWGTWNRVLTADEIAWIASGVAPIAVPEPATMALLGLGVLGLIRRKK